MKKVGIEIKWAIRYIFIYLAWAFGEKLCGIYDQNLDFYGFSSLLFYLLAFAVYFAAIREKKEEVFHKQMDWKRGCVSGVYLTIFIALLMPLAQISIHKAIAPEFFPNMIAKTGSARKAAATELFNLKSFTMQAVFFTLSIGVVYAATVAYFLQTKPKKVTMKPKILLLLVLSALAVSCVSSKLTIQNMDDKAPDLVLKNGVFLISELSHDPRYGYDKNYPINLFYKSTANDSINQPRFLDALAGPKGEKISYRKVETCCPFPIGRSDMGAGTLDVFEIVWPGQTKPVRLYLNIYGKGYLRVPMGFSLKKPKD